MELPGTLESLYTISMPESFKGPKISDLMTILSVNDPIRTQTNM